MLEFTGTLRIVPVLARDLLITHCANLSFLTNETLTESGLKWTEYH